MSRFAALLGLLLLAAGALNGMLRNGAGAADADRLQAWQTSLTQELAPRMDGAAPGRLLDVLRRASREPSILDLRLLDAGGTQLAAWPPRITPANWGVAAPPVAWLREQYLAVVGTEQVVPLRDAGRRLGSVRVRRLRGAGWLNVGVLGHAAAFALALLGLSGLLAPVGQAAGKPRTPAPRARSTGHDSAPPRLGVRLSRVLDDLNLGIALIDRKHHLRYVNRRFAEWTGWSRSEALNRPVFSVLRLQNDRGDALTLPLDSSPGAAQSGSEQNAALVPQHGAPRPVKLSQTALRRHDNTLGGALLLLQDRGGNEAADAELKLEVELARRTLDQLADGVAVTDKFGRIQRVNQRLNRLFAYASGELTGMPISKLLPVPFLNEPSVTLHHYVGSGNDKLPKVVGWRKDATTFPVELRVQELHDETHAFLLLIRDSGDRQRQDNLSMRLGRLLDYAAEEIYIFDAHSLYITEANREARDNLGYSLDQLRRMTLVHLAPGLDRRRFEDDLAALRGGEKRQITYRSEYQRADESRYPVSLRISYSREEEPPVFMALAQDVTEQRRAESKLEFLAHNDAMTRLPNRNAFLSRLEHLLAVRKAGQYVVLYFLDLDRFKRINDNYGHAVGDEVLRAFADRLRRVLGPDEYAARLAGDEFAVATLAETDQGSARLCAAIQDSLQEPVATAGGVLRLSVSIGAAVAVAEDNPESLLRRADQAMYRAKADGGDRVRWAET